MDADPMLDVPLAGGPVAVVGALDVARTAEGLVPRRLPAWTRPQLPDVFLDTVVQMPAGVRLRLFTDARALELDVLVTHIHPATEAVRPAVFEAVVAGQVRARAATTVGHEIVLAGTRPEDVRFVHGGPTTVHLDGLPGEAAVVDLWLPHAAVVELRALRVPAGAVVDAAHAPTGVRWVHYGSSISHCMEVAEPTAAWPVLAALATGAELQSLAFAGNCMLDPFVARTIRDLPAHAISLKLGINVVNGDTLRERTFGPAVHGFLDTVREGHPATPLLVVSPIWCPSVEQHPGPNVVGPNGRFTAVEGLEEARATCLTLEKVRRILAAVVETRRGLGDPNLHYLDGLRLFGPDDARDLPDDLHPNAAGYRRLAARFAELAFGAGGAFEHAGANPAAAAF